MAVIIEWHKKPSKQHTGTTEMRGLPKVRSAPTIYAHPADEDGTGVVRASSCARWTYSQADGTLKEVSSPNIFVDIDGSVSYSRYSRDHARYKKLKWYQRPWTEWGSKFGQDNAKYIFKKPLASGLQSSGSLSYVALLKIEPANTMPVTVSLTANIVTHAITIVTKNSKFSMAKTADASAEVYNEKDEYRRVKSIATLQWPSDMDTDLLTVTYSVVVPPGKPVEIGKAMVGLAYEINMGGSDFYCFSDVKFSVNPEGTPDTPDGLLDPDETVMDPGSEKEDH